MYFGAEHNASHPCLTYATFSTKCFVEVQSVHSWRFCLRSLLVRGGVVFNVLVMLQLRGLTYYFLVSFLSRLRRSLFFRRAIERQRPPALRQQCNRVSQIQRSYLVLFRASAGFLEKLSKLWPMVRLIWGKLGARLCL